jgi:hypothetical protein
VAAGTVDQRRPNKPLGGSPNDQLRLGEATPESVETLCTLNFAARFGQGELRRDTEPPKQTNRAAADEARKRVVAALRCVTFPIGAS